jgi:hypothetical protein
MISIPDGVSCLTQMLGINCRWLKIIENVKMAANAREPDGKGKAYESMWAYAIVIKQGVTSTPRARKNWAPWQTDKAPWKRRIKRRSVCIPGICLHKLLPSWARQGQTQRVWEIKDNETYGLSSREACNDMDSISIKAKHVVFDKKKNSAFQIPSRRKSPEETI